MVERTEVKGMNGLEKHCVSKGLIGPLRLNAGYIRNSNGEIVSERFGIWYTCDTKTTNQGIVGYNCREGLCEKIIVLGRVLARNPYCSEHAH